MSCTDLRSRYEFLDVLRQVQESHAVRHRGAILTDPLGDIFLPHLEVRCQPGVRSCFFNRIEIFTLEVLDESHLQHFFVRRMADNDWNFRKTEFTRRTKTALTCNQFKLPANAANDQWLNDAVLSDGADEFAQLLCLKLGSRLEGTWNHLVQRDPLNDVSRCWLSQCRRPRDSRHTGRCGNQGAEPFSERLFCHRGPRLNTEGQNRKHGISAGDFFDPAFGKLQGLTEFQVIFRMTE